MSYDLSNIQNLNNRVLNKVGKPPAAVYHYTTQAGLLGIVQTREIWATDVRFMNDSREFLYAQDLATKVLDEEAPTLPHRFLEACRTSLRTVERVHAYLASFSTANDDLSQWRGYGRGGGYGLKFSTEDLSRITLALGGIHAWLPCIYDQAEQQALFRDELNHLAAAFQGDASAVPSKYAADIFVCLLLFASLFKHPAFIHEKEWRMIALDIAGLSPRSRRYRTGPYSLVPYLAVSLSTDSISLPIKGVTVGPSPHPDMTLRSVRQLLEDHGCTDVDVELSKVPFRE